LFWASAKTSKTWPEWIAVSPTSKAGWWVRITVRMEKKQIILEICSVQRDEFHRLGDIRMDGPATIKAGQTWRLRQVIQATVPVMAVLAEDELERSAGGFRRCEALQTFQAKEPKVAAERSEERREPSIQRPRGSKTVELHRSSISKWIGAESGHGTRERKAEGSTVQEGTGPESGHGTRERKAEGSTVQEGTGPPNARL
jgi:hypothetical protein